MTAHLVGLPCVTAVSKLEIAAGRGTAERQLEGASETVEFPLPAVVTIDEGVARPRLPSLKGIMAAKKKPLEVKPAQLGEAQLTVQSIALPPGPAAGPHHRRRRGRGAGTRAAPPDRSEGALMANMFAFAESRGGALRKVAFEAVSAGPAGGRRHRRRRGARAPDRRAGHRRQGGRRSDAAGADVVVVVRARRARALQSRGLRRDGRGTDPRGGYRGGVLHRIAEGRDLAPRVAAALDVSMASDLTALRIRGRRPRRAAPDPHRQDRSRRCGSPGRRRSSRFAPARSPVGEAARTPRGGRGARPALDPAPRAWW